MSIDGTCRRTILGFLLSSIPALALADDKLLQQGGDLLNKLSGNKAQGGSGSGASLSTGEIGAGLKDALKVATHRTVGRVGKLDGYNGDPAIRIPLPGALEKVRGPLKAVGAGGMLDDLQVKMNRGAEQAAPKAIDIFGGAVSQMSFADARGILQGPKDAATQYFKRTTTPQLTTAFHPVVEKSLSSVGAVSTFKSVQSKAGSLPFAGDEVKRFDLTDFTVGKALDGLFHYLAVEEAAIRTDPAARTTDLLRKVFS